MRTALTLLWLMPSVAVAGHPADCETPARVSDIQAQTLQTTLAFATLDVEGFATAYDASHSQLECVAETLPKSTIVDFHRTEALGAFFEKDEERTRNAFQALLTVQPDWQLPQQLGAPGGALDLVLQKAKAKPPSLQVPVQVPDGLTLLIDGEPSESRPANIPALMQVVDGEGAVVWNMYLQAGEPLPDLTALASGADAASDATADADAEPSGEPVVPTTNAATGTEMTPGGGGSPADPPPVVEEADSYRQFGLGLEAGTILGLRLEYHPKSKTIGGVGLRVAAKYWGNAAIGFLPYIEFRAVPRLDIQISLGPVATGAVPDVVLAPSVSYSVGKGLFVRGGLVLGQQVVFPELVVGYFF